MAGKLPVSSITSTPKISQEDLSGAQKRDLEKTIAEILARLELSQAAFAKTFGLDLGVVQA